MLRGIYISHIQYIWSLTLPGCQELEKKRAEQQHLQEEVMRINAETMRAKQQRREEEKVADMRDMEYIQKKMVRWKANYLQSNKNRVIQLVKKEKFKFVCIQHFI